MCDVRLSRAQQAIRAVWATPKQAELLSVGPDAELPRVERVSCPQRDIAVEFLRTT